MEFPLTVARHAPVARPQAPRAALMLAALPALLSLLLLSACAGDISPRDGSGGGGALPGPDGAQAAFAKHASGYYQGTIDATGTDWVYLDLDTQTQVTPANPAASEEWDLAFRGHEIKLNGGASGAPPSGNLVAVYGEKTADGTPYPFEQVQAAPREGPIEYVSDQSGLLPGLPARLAMSRVPAADQSPNLLTGAGDYGWYRDSGRLDGSQIRARINVGYVLRTVECRHYKLRMTGYTDATGTPGYPRFDVQEISGPGCAASGGGVAPLGRATFEHGGSSTIVKLDAADEGDWVYLDLAGGQQTAPTAPRTDASGWDLAWRRTDIQVNGGSSGAGRIEIHAGLRDDWNARSSVPAGADWHTDAADALAFVTYPPREIGGECAFNADGDYGWYYYAGFCNKGNGNHHISPRDVVYLVRGRNGLIWKLRILAYYGDGGAAAQPTFEYAPITP